jgi:hypothetical protein
MKGVDMPEVLILLEALAQKLIAGGELSDAIALIEKVIALLESLRSQE